MQPSAASAASQTCDLNDRIVDQIKLIMAQRGIVESRFAKTLHEITGLSVSLAYKKLNKTSELTLAQIAQIGRYYNLDFLSALPVDGTLSSADQQKHLGKTINVAGFVLIGGERLPCYLKVVKASAASLSDQRFAAYQAEGTWYVSPRQQCAAMEPLFLAKRIELALSYDSTFGMQRVAVVDDERGSAENLRDYLNSSGYAATAFYNPSSARQAIDHYPFDVYFIDWRLGTETAEELICSIRSVQPDAPIILITAGAMDGPTSDVTLASLMERFEVQCKMKPYKMHDLISMIKK